ncbi:hypothetical protein PAPHI01_0245 [Pancytospora philotis]|nr:hypothetical protein PAPHI01_0245 [Pancytospora philotis]
MDALREYLRAGKTRKQAKREAWQKKYEALRIALPDASIPPEYANAEHPLILTLLHNSHTPLGIATGARANAFVPVPNYWKKMKPRYAGQDKYCPPVFVQQQGLPQTRNELYERSAMNEGKARRNNPRLGRNALNFQALYDGAEDYRVALSCTASYDGSERYFLRRCEAVYPSDTLCDALGADGRDAVLSKPRMRVDASKDDSLNERDARSLHESLDVHFRETNTIEPVKQPCKMTSESPHTRQATKYTLQFLPVSEAAAEHNREAILQAPANPDAECTDIEMSLAKRENPTDVNAGRNDKSSKRVAEKDKVRNRIKKIKF